MNMEQVLEINICATGYTYDGDLNDLRYNEFGLAIMQSIYKQPWFSTDSGLQCWLCLWFSPRL